jgi:hypothetical protein
MRRKKRQRKLKARIKRKADAKKGQKTKTTGGKK